MNFEYRQLTKDEWDLIAELDGLAGGELPEPEWHGYWGDNAFEFDRSVGAFDSARLVGESMVYTLGMSVPGGNVIPCGGVSWVSVLPTHRRRGIMTEMIRRQLDDIHARGEPLATLFASEAPIYGRFGFGVACIREAWEIDARNSAFISQQEPVGEIRFVEYGDAPEIFAPVLRQAMRCQPGMTTRSDAFWTARLRGRDSPPGKPLKTFHIAYHSDSGIEGFAAYCIRENAADFLFDSVIDILDLVALNDRAYAALWRFLLDIDLVGTVKARRPADEPLPWMLADPRAMKRETADGMYLRLIDAAAALSARRYDAEGMIVIGVVDEFCPWNGGRYLLDTGPDGASCSPTSRSADVTLSATDLGSIYLGGVSSRTLARAGRIDEHSGDSVARLDRMFRTAVPPWPHLFW